MKKLVLATLATIAAAPMALACDPGSLSCQQVPVPEISAMEGTAALAAVAAVLLFVWERRKRAA